MKIAGVVADSAHKGLPVIAHGDDVNDIYTAIQENSRGGACRLAHQKIVF